jgi:hypothetical protein
METRRLVRFKAYTVVRIHGDDFDPEMMEDVGRGPWSRIIRPGEDPDAPGEGGLITIIFIGDPSQRRFRIDRNDFDPSTMVKVDDNE